MYIQKISIKNYRCFRDFSMGRVSALAGAWGGPNQRFGIYHDAKAIINLLRSHNKEHFYRNFSNLMIILSGRAICFLEIFIGTFSSEYAVFASLFVSRSDENKFLITDVIKTF